MSTVQIQVNKLNRGFTLAEILLTLLVIGVVASLTIPSLINDMQEAELKTAYKKAYADGCQAWKMAVKDGLIIAANRWSDVNNYQNFLAFQSEFTISKNCNSNNTFDCWKYEEPWDSGFPSSSSIIAFIDNSGRAWTKPTTNHIYILVDTNGMKGPNKWGKDRFPFIPDIHPYSADVNTSYDIIPNVLQVWPDKPNPTSHCPSGNCFYSSWLYQ